ncbi:MAG: acetyltransferase [Planctomycetes bacterium]|nr:acetyltransferase [Planctomycetota bacterium]
MQNEQQKTLLVFGVGGHGKVVAESAALEGRFSFIVFGDDYPNPSASPVVKERFLGNKQDVVQAFRDGLFGSLIVAVGDNGIRQPMQEFFMGQGIPVETVCHPASVLAASVTVGVGSVVMAGAVVQPDAVVGCGVILNTNCSVDHDCSIADYVHCAPGSTLCGSVTVGEGTMIGAGATVIQGVRIGAHAVIGAGAVVTRDVADGLTVVGVPARPL